MNTSTPQPKREYFQTFYKLDTMCWRNWIPCRAAKQGKGEGISLAIKETGNSITHFACRNELGTGLLDIWRAQTLLQDSLYSSLDSIGGFRISE